MSDEPIRFVITDTCGNVIRSGVADDPSEVVVFRDPCTCDLCSKRAAEFAELARDHIALGELLGDSSLIP